VDRLLRDHGIFTVVRDIEGGQGVRVTPHLYTSKAQLDRLVQALAMITASA
jgi:selenocysteine lyase/cysteine desulfurase